MTAYAGPALFHRAGNAGANGFVLERTGDFQLVDKIRRAAQERGFPPSEWDMDA